ncbi:hypothetical protein OF83DRAFT_1071441, partial [Amylostereum chailletii]
GKVVGGSSAINSMIWQRASEVEYDNWETVFQNPGWNFKGLEPYFKKVEDWTPPEILFPEQHYDPALATEHGKAGPIDVSYDTFLTGVDVPSVAAANSLGVPTNSNPDGGNVTYISLTARSVDPARGIRSYAGNSYYQPVQNRTNLKLLSNATVLKVDFAKKGKKGAIVATGVEYAVGGKNYTVSVGKEVILAAGSLKTPQVLELSGIGNKTILNSLGIDVIIDFPQIGENFQDHPVTLLEFKVKNDVLTLDRLNYNQTYAQEQQELYNTNATGALTFTEAVIGPLPLQRTVNESTFNAMLSGLNVSLAAQGSQTPIQKAQYAALTKLVTGGEVGWFELTVVPSGGVAGPAENNTNYLTSVAIELHPFGRGFVHVNTTDPYAQPVIDPKFLEIPFDAEVLVHGSQWVRKWMETQPIAGLIDSELLPSLNVTSDAQWDSYIRTVVRTTNHPLGTTAMASRELGGVVGPDLKVYGLNNVRVVDAGIIPMTLGVAIQSTVYAVAEKVSLCGCLPFTTAHAVTLQAADIVKEAYNI